MSDTRDDALIRDEIARRAYLRFCDRGCVHGGDTEDWFAAEGEVLAEQAQAAEIPNGPGVRPPRRNARNH